MENIAEFSERERLMRRVVGTSEKLTHTRVTHIVTFFSLAFTFLVWGISFFFPDNPKISSLDYPGILKHVEYINFISFTALLVTNIIAYLVDRQTGKKTQLLYVMYMHFICAFAGFMTVTDRVPLLYGMMGQRFNLIRHLVWIFTTPVFVLMIAHRLSFADKKNKEVNLALAADIVMIIFGAAAEFVPPMLATVCHLLAYVAFVGFLHVYWKLFQRAVVEQSTQSEFNLTVASWWCQIIWWTFPTIASLSFVSLISVDVAEALYTSTHLLTKIVFTSLLVQDYCLSENEKEHLRNIEVEEANQIILFRQLEELVTQKNAFLSSTSHELRTPIHGIIGLSQALLGGSFGPLDEQISRQLTAINDCGSRLHMIVSNILEVADITASTRTAENPLVHLLPLVSGCVGEIHSFISDQVKLEIDAASLADLPPVFADEREIKQIINNLLRNAVKFTDSGKVSIVGECQQTGTGSVIKISIQDTGVGIPQSELVKIFEPFVQVESTDTRTYGGAGLGLSVVKKIVNILGGQVFVTSQVGKGSTFSFTMPVAQDDSLPNTPPKILNPDTESVNPSKFPSFLNDIKLQTNEETSKDSIDLASTPGSQHSEDRRSHSEVYGTPLFLIVEEDAADCFTLSSILESVDIRVQTALSYKDMTSFLGGCEEWPDCILIDAKMLCETNFEAIFTEFPGLKACIIALYSNNMTVTGEGANILASAYKYGVVDFILKPFNADEIVKQVGLQLSRQRKRSLAGSQEENLKPGSNSDGITCNAPIPPGLQLHPLVTVMAVEVLGLDTHLLNQEGVKAFVLVQKLSQLIQDTLKSHQIHQVEMNVGGCLCIAGHTHPEGRFMHAAASFNAAQAVIACVQNIDVTPLKPTVKVGLHVGPVYTSGIGSESKCCIFGETVSLARHLLVHGHPNTIHMSNFMADEIDLPSLENESKLLFDKTVPFTCPDVEGTGFMTSVIASPLSDAIPREFISKAMSLSEVLEEVDSQSGSAESSTLQSALEDAKYLAAEIAETQVALNSQEYKLQNVRGRMEEMVQKRKDKTRIYLSKKSECCECTYLRTELLRRSVDQSKRCSTMKRISSPFSLETARSVKPEKILDIDPKNFTRSAWSLDKGCGYTKQQATKKAYRYELAAEGSVVQNLDEDDEDAYLNDFNQTGRCYSAPAAHSNGSPKYQGSGFNSIMEENDMYGVVAFLEDLGLAHYVPLFQSKGIGMSALGKLNDENLKDLGVPTVGARMRILFGLQDHFGKLDYSDRRKTETYIFLR